MPITARFIVALKAVMWSVEEETALAEAEIEYEDYTSDTVLVEFPVREAPANFAGLLAEEPVSAREPALVIWTTTLCTIPGNRAMNALIARSSLKRPYPHSWRSKKQVIFRNTPQWFIAMDREIAALGDTLRRRALDAIEQIRWVPERGKNRMTGMLMSPRLR